MHYGWVIPASGAFGSFMTVPAQTAGVSVFIDQLIPRLRCRRLTR